MSAGPTILELVDVHRHFAVDRSFFRRKILRAVDGVSLQLRKGDVLGVVGESGCGKTTLSKMMLGLIPTTDGQVLLDGKPLSSFDRRTVARRVQFVFQDPYSALNPRHTIGAIVGQPLRVHGIGASADREKSVREMLNVVGLPARVYDSYPGQLSGGQRQRVVIARALILRPDILVCDEPTSALDVSVQAQILNLLLDLRHEFGLTYVLVSHNLTVVEHMATQVAVMYLGRIVEYADAERLFADPQHPYTRVLLRSAMTIAPRGGVPDVRMGGTVPNPIQVPSGCRFHPRCPEALPICKHVVPPLVVRRGDSAECHLVPGAPAAAEPVA